MRSNIVRVGNSRGIRIPKALLEQCGLDSAVELEVEGDRLVIRRARSPREGWAEAFRDMARRGDDQLIDAGRWGQTDWDRTEWQW